MKSESKFQKSVVEKVEKRLPGCFITRNDPTRVQGILDLLILFKNRWAMLEVKKDATSDFRPNQEYYVERFNEMSFAAVIHPGNEEQVLDDLQSALGSTRKARLSKSK